jgi:predicted DNA-binding antitoxin AbrB/MazE fold protein
MQKTVEAVYENGVLKPKEPLNGLAEGQAVYVTVSEAITDPDELKRRREAFLKHLEDIGMLVRKPEPNPPPMPADFKPITVQGEPLSETVIKMRG